MNDARDELETSCHRARPSQGGADRNGGASRYIARIPVEG